MTHRVNFFIVGAPKCGTTTLYHFLSGHEQVDFGVIKEPHIFASDLKLKGTTSRADYIKSYDPSNPNTRIFGDASVMHLFSGEAAKNIFDYNPAAKILIMLRKPLEFIVSYHHEQVYNQIEDCKSLQVAWDLTDRRCVGLDVPSSCPDPRLLDYKSIAYFDDQIRRFIDRFPPEQVKIGFVADMRHREAEFITALYKFLDVAPDCRVQLGHHASAKTYRHAWRKQAVKLATHPTAQLIWKIWKQALGIDRRFQLVRKFRIASTVAGQKGQIDSILAKAIEAHYESNWKAVEKLSRPYGLLKSDDLLECT